MTEIRMTRVCSGGPGDCGGDPLCPVACPMTTDRKGPAMTASEPVSPDEATPDVRVTPDGHGGSEGVTGVLDRLEELHAQATPGQWSVARSGGIDAGDYATVIGRGDVDCMSRCYGGTSTIDGDNLPADAAAIVAEHNAFGALIAAVRAAYGLAEEMGRLRPKDRDQYPIAAVRNDIGDALRAVLDEALGEVTR